jgi:hypothetical protein
LLTLTFGIATLKQEVEAGAFVAVSRPFAPGGIANLSDGEPGEFTPMQDVSVEKIRLGFFNERPFHSRRRRQTENCV